MDEVNKQGMGKISVREKEKKTFGSYQGTPKEEIFTL